MATQPSEMNTAMQTVSYSIRKAISQLKAGPNSFNNYWFVSYTMLIGLALCSTSVNSVTVLDEYIEDYVSIPRHVKRAH